MTTTTPREFRHYATVSYDRNYPLPDGGCIAVAACRNGELDNEADNRLWDRIDAAVEEQVKLLKKAIAEERTKRPYQVNNSPSGQAWHNASLPSTDVQYEYELTLNVCLFTRGMSRGDGNKAIWNICEALGAKAT